MLLLWLISSIWPCLLLLHVMHTVRLPTCSDTKCWRAKSAPALRPPAALAAIQPLYAATTARWSLRWPYAW